MNIPATALAPLTTVTASRVVFAMLRLAATVVCLPGPRRDYCSAPVGGPSHGPDGYWTTVDVGQYMS